MWLQDLLSFVLGAGFSLFTVDSVDWPFLRSCLSSATVCISLHAAFAPASVPGRTKRTRESEMRVSVCVGGCFFCPLPSSLSPCGNCISIGQGPIHTF